MMGPEAMGFTPPNLDWWNEKVCRDYLFGTCLHDTFSNTVSHLLATRGFTALSSVG